MSDEGKATERAAGRSADGGDDRDVWRARES